MCEEERKRERREGESRGERAMSSEMRGG